MKCEIILPHFEFRNVIGAHRNRKQALTTTQSIPPHTQEDEGKELEECKCGGDILSGRPPAYLCCLTRWCCVEETLPSRGDDGGRFRRRLVSWSTQLPPLKTRRCLPRFGTSTVPSLLPLLRAQGRRSRCPIIIIIIVTTISRGSATPTHYCHSHGGHAGLTLPAYCARDVSVWERDPGEAPCLLVSPSQEGREGCEGPRKGGWECEVRGMRGWREERMHG